MVTIDLFRTFSDPFLSFYKSARVYDIIQATCAAIVMVALLSIEFGPLCKHNHDLSPEEKGNCRHVSGWYRVGGYNRFHKHLEHQQPQICLMYNGVQAYPKHFLGIQGHDAKTAHAWLWTMM